MQRGVFAAHVLAFYIHPGNVKHRENAVAGQQSDRNPEASPAVFRLFFFLAPKLSYHPSYIEINGNECQQNTDAQRQPSIHPGQIIHQHGNPNHQDKWQ